MKIQTPPPQHPTTLPKSEDPWASSQANATQLVGAGGKSPIFQNPRTWVHGFTLLPQFFLQSWGPAQWRAIVYQSGSSGFRLSTTRKREGEREGMGTRKKKREEEKKGERERKKEKREGEKGHF